MKITVRGTPEEISTFIEAQRQSPLVAKVSSTNVSKRDSAHKTGSALVFITFKETLPNTMEVEIWQRGGKTTKRKRGGPGWIYLMSGPTEDSKRTYKIGKTINPKSRKKTFGVKLPFATEFIHLIQTDEMSAFEKSLHKLFADKRVRGEFFALSDKDVQFIVGLGDNCIYQDLPDFCKEAGYGLE